MNWNILVASGKEIKRDSISSVNENRVAYILYTKVSSKYIK